MTLTAGTISLVSVGAQVASLSLTAATSGTSPYTYQWYRSTTTGFSPGGGNIISGATSLTLSDTGLIPGTTYYYKNRVTDSASPAATADATQLAVTTSFNALNQNQFAQAPVVGMIDQMYNFNTVPVIIDVTQSGVLYAGAPVKLVASTTGGPPHVIGCTANSDAVFGYINYDIRNISWAAGMTAEISCAGNVMYMYATGAITQGHQIQSDVVNNGVASSVGSSGAEYIGWAFDGFAGAGSLGRVHIVTPSFTVF